MSILHQFRGSQGGFGLQSYNRARAAGLNPKQIAAAMGSSGMSLGYRARDAIIRDTASQAEGLKQQRNAAQSQAASLRSQYEGQIADYKKRLDDYSGRVSSLTNQYQSALKESQGYQAQATEWQGKYTKKTGEYEAAKQEADRYRNEAVGRQLSQIRSGGTTKGSQASVGGGIGDYRKGGQTFQSGSGDTALTRAAKAEGGLTDSVLNRKGPVVERLQTRASQTAPGGNSNQGLASGRTGTTNYYASRFR
ncbi:MAG TPA: hypothetical protein DCX77_05910 [Acidimicrobiaceae bacterium]|nr:hypothetical protein [Acidimicrobiaceae bacterium]